MKVGIIDIPCNFCGAERGELCREVCHAGVYGTAPVAGQYHSQRIADAINVEDTANKLLGELD